MKKNIEYNSEKNLWIKLRNIKYKIFSIIIPITYFNHLNYFYEFTGQRVLRFKSR